MTDQVRAGFGLSDPDEADKVIAQLAQKYQIIDLGWYTMHTGYFDRKIYVRFNDGMIGEVQLWPKDMIETNTISHKLYEKQRELPIGDAERNKIDSEIRAHYSEATPALSSKWKAILGKGGKSGNSASQSSSGITWPSIPMAGSSTQAPLTRTNAIPGLQTNGSPKYIPTVASDGNLNSDILKTPFSNSTAEKSGYFDRKIYVRFNDGMIGEVQLWPKDMIETNTISHRLYKQWRQLPISDPRRDVVSDEIKALYSAARKYLSANWNAILGNGGKSGNSLSHSLADQTRASFQTSSSDTQLPSLKTQAAPGVQMTGSSSNVQNSDFGGNLNSDILKTPFSNSTAEKSGYFDRKIYVRFNDGMIGEVQLWPKDLIETNTISHRLYEKERVLPDGDPEKLRLSNEIKALYSAAMPALSSKWKAVLGKGGKSGNSASQSSIDIIMPFQKKADESSNQAPLYITNDKPGVLTQGSPSYIPTVALDGNLNSDILKTPFSNSTAEKSGYFDRKIYVRFNDGMIGEVQLWPKDMIETNTISHKLYEKQRELPIGDAESERIDDEINALYSAATPALASKWKAILGKGGKSGNSASQSSNGITWPSIPMAGSSTQAPLTRTNAIPGLQTNGSPKYIPTFALDGNLNSDILKTPFSNSTADLSAVNAISAEESLARSQISQAGEAFGLVAEHIEPAQHDYGLARTGVTTLLTELPVFDPAALPKPASDQPALDLKSAKSRAVGIFQFDAKALLTDAKRFQFKDGGDGAGVTHALKGVTVWDPAKANQLIVWQATDGNLYVVDGHQRSGLARRLLDEGYEDKIQIPGLLYREADGVSASDARAIAAAKNIAEGSGSPIDGAKVLRERPDLFDGSMPLSRTEARQSMDLAMDLAK